MSMHPSFKIYPSLLDKFQRYLDTTPENFMYQDEDNQWHMNYSESTGEYQYSPEEVDELSKKQLLDAINRVPYKSEASTKGTVFNEVVDAFINGNRPSKILMKGSRSEDAIYTECDGMKFSFCFSFVENFAKKYQGAVSQLYVKAPIETDYGVVELYGYVDEVYKDKVIDLKTTSRYTFGDFADHWQRYVYPYCLIRSEKMSSVTSFIYSVVVLKGGTSRTPLIYGTTYEEEYTFDYEESKRMLKAFLERFIEFLQENRDKITDSKIFNKI